MRPGSRWVVTSGDDVEPHIAVAVDETMAQAGHLAPGNVRMGG